MKYIKFHLFLLFFCIIIYSASINKKGKELKEKITIVCDEKNFYDKEKVTAPYQKLSDYIGDDQIRDNIFVDLLTESESNSIKLDFILDFVPYLILMVVGVVFFICWVVTIFVYFCGKCNCYENKPERMSLIGSVIYFLTNIFFAGVLVAGIISIFSIK